MSEQHTPPPLPNNSNQPTGEDGKYQHYQQTEFQKPHDPQPPQGGAYPHQYYQQRQGMAQPPYTQQPVAIPNSGGVLAMGIISIPFAGLIGIILAIVALSMASTGEKLYQSNPSAYTVGSYNNLKAGRICAIIGLVLTPIFIIIIFSMR